MPLYELDGHVPDIPDPASVWIAPDANVIGKVRLLPGASLWFGVTLRGDNEWIEVGEGTNLQEGVIGHTDPGFPMTLGRDVTVGHGAIIHGCTIGDGALIGMGATVLNGATIGASALVGANALVTEGKSFEPGALIVGAPAKAVRSLSDEQQAGLRATAERYVANAGRYRATLRRIDG